MGTRLHGESHKTPEHFAWMAMIGRCTNPTCHDYDRYGGRGITVCARWRDYVNFLADMGRKPSRSHTLDRWPDVNGNYEPGNCRWATWQQQQRNRSTNRVIVVNGVPRLLVEWAEVSGLHIGTLWRRLRRGWTPERAVSTPVRPRS